MIRMGVRAAALLALSTASAQAAETIGVSLGLLGNNLFQTLIRDGMDRHVRTLNGVSLQVEDAGGDVNGPLDQVRNLIASEALLPLDHVNIAPDNIDRLPPRQAFVGSDERESGTPEAKEICRVLKGRGKVAIMVGDLAVTVFQDAAGQGPDAIETALKLVHGEAVPKAVTIPFRLVTRDNAKDFAARG